METTFSVCSEDTQEIVSGKKLKLLVIEDHWLRKSVCNVFDINFVRKDFRQEFLRMVESA